MTTTAPIPFISAGLVAALLLAAAPARGACPGVEQRQFDFWIGRWEVLSPEGQNLGENRIEPVAEGCGLLESWRGASGFVGNSLNSYDGATRQWRQVWVDGQGGRLELSGGWDGRAMVLAGESADPKRPGVRLKDRISWTPAADGGVRQQWERSEDGGQRWSTVFDGRYRRLP